MNKDGPFKFTVCSMCGKEYIKQPGSIYHVEYIGKINHCCSYTCYKQALKVKEDARREYKEEKQAAKRRSFKE